MDFLELVNKRESVRKYTDKKVDREIIEKILECSRLAPSACNAQPWKFIVVDDDDKLEKIAKSLYNPLIGINKFALSVPCFIIAVGEKRNITSKAGELIKKKDYSSMDIGIACEHIALSAAELGLGTCLMGWFNEEKLKKILEIPKDREIFLVISLGYGSEDTPRKKVRKNINEIMSYNKY